MTWPTLLELKTSKVLSDREFLTKVLKFPEEEADSLLNGGIAFVEAIIEDPADFTTRLVYADYLEDNNRLERAKRVRERTYYQERMGEWEKCPRCSGVGRIAWLTGFSPLVDPDKFSDISAVRQIGNTTYVDCGDCNAKGKRKKVYPIEWVLGDEDA